MTDGNTTFGTTPEVFTAQLDEWGADVIGLNCGVGPAIVLSAIEKMRAVTKKKLSAQPNAGLPRDVQGRQFYMCSPEYMAKFAKRFIQAGAKFVGGCCGTTPAHIKLIADAVRAVSPARAASGDVFRSAGARARDRTRRRHGRSGRRAIELVTQDRAAVNLLPRSKCCRRRVSTRRRRSIRFGC